MPALNTAISRALKYRHQAGTCRQLVTGLLVTALLLTMTASVPATAQDKNSAENRLKNLQTQIDASRLRKKEAEAAARSAESDAERSRQEMIALGADIREREARAEATSDKIAALEQEVLRKTRRLDDRRQEIAALLGALERLGARPAALAFLQPGEAIKTARSASLLSSLIPELEKKVALIRLDLIDLARSETALLEERQTLASALAGMEEQRTLLSSIIKERQVEARKARGDISAETRRVAKMVKEARTLEDLIKKLEQDAVRRSQEPAGKSPQGAIPLTGRFIKARGKLPQPVTGRIVQKYGSKQLVGTLKGIQIDARSDAQVIAPFDGQVVFAGRFRDYGHLVIIRHGDGYHSLLAGMAETYVLKEQWLLGGEPVGKMAPRATPLPQLYLELRRKGRPFNPSSWLTHR